MCSQFWLFIKKHNWALYGLFHGLVSEIFGCPRIVTRSQVCASAHRRTPMKMLMRKRVKTQWIAKKKRAPEKNDASKLGDEPGIVESWAQGSVAVPPQG